MPHVRLVACGIAALVIASAASANVIGRGHPVPPPPEQAEDSGPVIVPPPRPVPPLPPTRDAIDALLAELEIGPADHYRDLTVYPLRRRHGSARLRPLTFDEALRRGDLVVRERGAGRVNEVEVRNDARRHVFLMAGEVLTGAKQDRMFRDDVLLPPHSGWVPVSVYCVEQGRWTPVSERFRSEKTLVPPALRRQAQLHEPQARVWAGVNAAAAENRVRHGATKRFNEIYATPTVRARLSAYRAHYVPPRWGRTVGAVVCSRGRILGADIFSDPDLFDALWPKILDSYAMDARRGRGWRGGNEWVRRFLRGARSDNSSRHHVPTPGVGELLRISGRTSGFALTYRDEAVHLNLHGEPIFVPLTE
ncbi:MAG: ARPP-1 family domain-containing protein [Armatimonadota bacterium]